MNTTDWIAIGILAAVLVAIFGWLQRGSAGKPPKKPRQIVIDGTNVMFWRNEVAQLATLQLVLKRLRQEGLDPVVFLDASTRHHIKDRSMNEKKFARALGVTKNNLMIAPKGTEADQFLLEFAQSQKLSVVSNDRFRDRPDAARNVKLIKGRFEGEKLVLKGL